MRRREEPCVRRVRARPLFPIIRIVATRHPSRFPRRTLLLFRSVQAGTSERTNEPRMHLYEHSSLIGRSARGVVVETRKLRKRARSYTRRGECLDMFALPRHVNFTLDVERFASFFLHSATFVARRDTNLTNNKRSRDRRIIK